MRFIAVSFSFLCIYFLQPHANAQNTSLCSYFKTQQPDLLVCKYKCAEANKALFQDYLASESFKEISVTPNYIKPQKIILLSGVKDFYIYSGLSPPVT